MTTNKLEQVIAFLMGEGPLDGVWFNQTAAGRAPFWWREHLQRAALASAPAGEAVSEHMNVYVFHNGETVIVPTAKPYVTFSSTGIHVDLNRFLSTPEGKSLVKGTTPAADASEAVPDYRRALEKVVKVMGPQVPACSGCEWEWSEALRIANEALAAAPPQPERPASGERVAFAVELPDGSISPLGWMDMRVNEAAQKWAVLGEGCRYVYAYRDDAMPGECRHPSQSTDGIFTECDHCGATILEVDEAREPRSEVQYAVDEAMVERAMRARIPGGSEAWVWLFNCEGGMAPQEKHRDWFRRVVTAAALAQQEKPE